MKAMRSAHRAHRRLAAGIGRLADPRAGGRGIAASGPLLCRLPHRSARHRRRPAARENAHCPRRTNRRHGGQDRATAEAEGGRENRNRPGSTWPARGRGLAAAHLWPVHVLHSGHRRTCASRPASPAIMPMAATPSMPSHRDFAYHCPRRSATSRPRAVVFGHHRLSGLAAVQSAAGRKAGAVRIRLVGPRGDPDRPASRLPGVRGHARRKPPPVGPANGRVWVGEDAREMPVKVDSAILLRRRASWSRRRSKR